MSKVISLRFQEAQVERLDRLARRLGRTPSETGALLVEESLRRSEFANIDFRNSPGGRQAYVQSSTLAVWEVELIARAYEMNVEKAASHLGWSILKVQSAVNYAMAYPDEINAAIADNEAIGFAELARMLPQAHKFVSK